MARQLSTAFCHINRHAPACWRLNRDNLRHTEYLAQLPGQQFIGTSAASNAVLVAGSAMVAASWCCSVQCEPPTKEGPRSEKQATDWSLYSDASGLWQREWQKDWDGCAPAPPDGTEEKMKTKGRTRHLFFIRHGQYDLEDKEHGLTQLGQKQSHLLGERLAQMTKSTKKDKYGEINITYSGLHSSNVKRAMQTADIIAEHIPEVVRFPPDPLLAEGPPSASHPTTANVAVRRFDRWKESARIEACFRAYVHRDVDHKKLAEKERKREKNMLREDYHPEGGSKNPVAIAKEKDDTEAEGHSFEIIVCHMNVIRFFVMRALQLPPEAWLRLRGDNCGITEVIIRPNGTVSLGRFGDTGHLPIEMTTFH